MRYLWLLLPAIGWGILPLIVVKTNSKVVNQIFGTAVGTLIISNFVMIILRPSLSATTFIMATVAGAMWIVGQLGQVHCLSTNWRFPLSGSLDFPFLQCSCTY